MAPKRGYRHSCQLTLCLELSVRLKLVVALWRRSHNPPLELQHLDIGLLCHLDSQYLCQRVSVAVLATA
jgi:hypothetical protein